MSTQLTWLGHGTWLIEMPDHVVLLDPFLDDSPTAPIKASDVHPDTILVSHGHFDHIADAAAIATRTGAQVVTNFEICEWLGAQGIENTQPMNHGGGVELAFGRITYTVAHHSSGLPDGAYGGNPGGFVLNLADGTIYFACDTSLFSDMQLIGRSGIDLAVLPIGDVFTMGPDDAIEAVKFLKPKRVVPAHYNTWPPIEQDAKAWAERVRAETTAEPLVPQPGEKIELQQSN
ncbi:MAG: metal-dependent hydrolase [Planctomycetales bacterium]